MRVDLRMKLTVGLLALATAAVAAASVRALAGQATPPAQGRGGAQPVTIRAARLLDGIGGTLQNGVIEIQGSKITAVDQRTGPVTYDLGDMTLMPGMIDVHVHLQWIFGPDGRYGGR